MNSQPVLYLMTGLLFGTTLLSLGVALGFWMGRRTAAPSSPGPSSPTMDPQQFLTLVRSMANWTSDVAGDVSKYQSQLTTLTEQAQKNSIDGNNEEFQRVLDQILSANRQLQSRLEAAEQKLESQTNQLEGFLTEARTDPLTGLSNRRVFDQRMDEQFAKFKSTQQPFTLALLDIDHFKKINDTYGHASGDEVLREVGSRLREISDQCNLIARYGGEEFAVVFNASLAHAATIMDQLRASVAAKPVMAEGKSIRVTFSCGVAQLHTGDRVGNLFRYTDEALYCAKQNGRNMVVTRSANGYESNGKSLQLKMNNTPASVPAAHAAGDSHRAQTSSASLEASPTIDELEVRILKRLDHLVNEEAKRLD